MLLRSLDLHNFRIHRSTELVFKPGITAIVGHNGSGKSSLLESIGWILFGPPAIRSQVKTLRWDGAGARDHVTGTLTFELDNQTYEVRRTLTDAYVRYNGGELARGAAGVTAYIAQLLMPLDEWRYSFLCEQKQLAFLGQLKGVARARFLNAMMGYDFIEDAQALARGEAKQLSSRYQLLTANRQPIAAIETELGFWQKQRADLREQGKAAVQVLAQMRADASDLEEVARAANRKRDEQHAIRDRLDELRVRRGSISSAIERQRRSEIDAEPVRSWLADYVRLHEQREGDIRELRQRLADVTAAVAAVDAPPPAVTVRRARYNVLREEVQRLQREHEAWIELDYDTGHCPTCFAPLTETAFYSRRADLENGIDAATQAAQTLGKELQQLEDEWSNKRAEIFAERARIADELSTLVAQQTADDSRSREYERRLAQLVKDRVSGLDEQLADVEGKIAALEHALQDLELTAEEHDAFEALQTLQAAVQSRATDVTHLHGAYRAAKEAEARAETALNDARTAADAMAELSRGIVLHRALDLALGSLRETLNDRLRPELTARASSLVRDLTDGRYTGVDLDDAYQPTLLQGAVRREVISGGEEDIAALTLRLAAAELISARRGHRIQMMILDEVLAALDSTRQAAVTSMLARLRDRFSQVLLISHVEAVDADHVIRLAYDEQAGSSAVV